MKTLLGQKSSSGIHLALVGLLRELPKPGSAWPNKDKQRFMDAFMLTIDCIYPSDENEELFLLSTHTTASATHEPVNRA